MTAGVAVLAAVPIAVGAAGYGIIKGVKYLFSQHKLNNEAFDPKWEEPQDGENKQQLSKIQVASVGASHDHYNVYDGLMMHPTLFDIKQ